MPTPEQRDQRAEELTDVSTDLRRQLLQAVVELDLHVKQLRAEIARRAREDASDE